MNKDFIYYLDLREVEIVHRWRRTCRREKICAKCRFKDKCEDTFEDFQETRKENKMVVQLLKDDPRFKLKKGEIFEAQVYWLDPEKITLLKRLPDGFDPECNQYRGSVKILK